MLKQEFLNITFPVSVIRSSSIGYDMPLCHYHNAYEICIPLCDGITYFVNNRIFQTYYGNLMLYNNKDIHRVSVSDNTKYDRIIITFNPEFIRKTNIELLSIFDKREDFFSNMSLLSANELEKLLAMIGDLEAQLSNHDLLWNVGVRISLCNILLYLNRKKMCLSKADVNQSIKNRLPPKLALVCEYIDSNYSKQLTLDNISAECFIEKSYMCRLFKREFGYGIFDYITYLRLSQAIVILQNGIDIKTAAYYTGFNSETYFSTVFKKHIGFSPMNFLKKYSSDMKLNDIIKV